MEVSENMTFSAKNDKAILNAVSWAPGESRWVSTLISGPPRVMSHLLISCLAVGLCNLGASFTARKKSSHISFFRSQMLDREGKREKILEGKLREIKIKLKKQNEQQTLELLKQAEKLSEDIKVQEEAPKAKPSLEEGSSKLFFFCRHHRIIFWPFSVLIGTAEGEFNQMIEEELQRRIKELEAHDNPKKSPRVRKKKEEDADDASDGEEPHEEAVNGTQNGEHTNGTTNGHHHENGDNESEVDVERET